jgi:hypothetical protein
MLHKALRLHLERAGDDELRELIGAAQAELDRRAQPPESPASRATVEEVRTAVGCYRLELVKCGKCHRCEGGPVHGPYWYWYGRDANGRSVSRYIGKQRPVPPAAGPVA